MIGSTIDTVRHRAQGSFICLYYSFDRTFCSILYMRAKDVKLVTSQ